MSISKIHARYIYDSRGNPTVEVDVTTAKGLFRTAVPSGASTGVSEAVELRDNDPKKWGGKGVLTAVANVNDVIAPALIKSGLKVTEQRAIDDFLIKLDGTPNKAKLGANAILGVSLAVAYAGTAELGIPLYEHVRRLAGAKEEEYVLPVPFMNVLNGGEHAGGSLAFQEFMIAPLGFDTYSDALRAGTEIYHILKKSASKKYGALAGNVGDEGGIAPDLQTAEEALDLVYGAIKDAGYDGKVSIALDSASSEFFKNQKYDLDFKNEHDDESKRLTGVQLAAYYKQLADKYPIVSFEDPFAEDDWDAWVHFYEKYNKDVQIVGDDLTVTNPKFVQKAIDLKAANALLLKVNQIGTLSESIDAANLAKGADWGVMVSHRSGECEVDYIADIAVGLRAGQLKSGSASRTDRLIKWNRLLRIEEELGSKAVFAGKKFHTIFAE